jgi:YjbE family integral membrane protein
LKLVGGVALLGIAIKMLIEEDSGADGKPAPTTMLAAVTTIAIADATMSIDNVIAVAGAAQGDFWLIIFGLILSIPLCIFGAKLISMIIDRFPILVWAGAGLLGWIAGETIVDDPIFRQHVVDYSHAEAIIFSAIPATAFVLLMGTIERMIYGPRKAVEE